MIKRTKRAFTLVELLVVISIIALLVGLLLPAIGRARKNAQQAKCGTQVRAIHQGLVAWSSNNREKYPIPHDLDSRHDTEPDYGGINNGWKDRTGNIWSILMFNKIIGTPEIFVSPSEEHPNIRPICMEPGCNGSRPELVEFQTVRPGFGPNSIQNTENEGKTALWDPSFKGAPVPASEQADGLESDVPDPIGNNSYAHAPLRGQEGYEPRWGALFSQPTVPIVSNRGPVFKFAAQIPTNAENYEIDDTMPGEAYSLLIHGGKSTWEGNVAYNDGHVAFETSYAPDELTLYDKSKKYPDNLFVSEILSEDHSEYRKDAFLFIWKKGLQLNPTLQNKKFDFLPQAKRDAMWADELQSL